MKYLNLQENEIEDEGVEIFPRVLRQCPTLKRLYLEYHDFSGVGRRRLCACETRVG
jgi:hypothetical protein